jgi:predicted lipid-binding transport protein (Tim44 family)
MLRTVFTIGLFAVLGLFALRLVFGILPWIFGLFAGLIGFAIKILIIGLVIYAVIRIFSPDTARKMRNWGKDDSF